LRTRLNFKPYNIFDFKEKEKENNIKNKVERGAAAKNKDNEGSAPEKNADKEDINK
jgi:hypothetical protein